MGTSGAEQGYGSCYDSCSGQPPGSRIAVQEWRESSLVLLLPTSSHLLGFCSPAGPGTVQGLRRSSLCLASPALCAASPLNLGLQHAHNVDEHTRTWHFQPTPPMSTYLGGSIAAAAGCSSLPFSAALAVAVT